MGTQDEDSYCRDCGARLASGANFCVQCGTPVRRSVPVPEAVAARPIESLHLKLAAVESTPAEHVHDESTREVAQMEAIPLLDGRRRYYVVDRSWWETKFGDIEDEKGNLIGHLYQNTDIEHKIVELREADNQIIAAMIHRSLSAIPDRVEIRNDEEEFLATVRHKILAIRQNEAWIEDDQGEKIFDAKGHFKDFSFNIYDATGNLAAEIDKTSMWRDIFPSDIASGPEQKHAIIVQNDVDRRLAVSFAIAIDEEVHKH